MFDRTRFGAAILSNGDADLSIIANYLNTRLPNNPEQRNRIYTEVHIMRTTDGIWPLRPSEINAANCIECPNSDLENIDDPFTTEMVQMLRYRIRLLDDITSNRSLSWICPSDDSNVEDKRIGYGLMGEACYFLTHGGAEWALDAGDKTDFISPCGRRVDVTTGAEYKRAADYIEPENYLIVEMVTIDGTTMSEIMERFSRKGDEIYEEVIMIEESYFTWTTRFANALESRSFSNMTTEEIEHWLLYRIPRDCIIRVGEIISNRASQGDIREDELEFALVGVEQGIWAEWIDGPTYHHWDSASECGYNEFEGDIYTVLVGNRFNEIFKTTDDIEDKVGTIRSYEDEHPNAGECLSSGEIPHWAIEMIESYLLNLQ